MKRGEGTRACWSRECVSAPRSPPPWSWRRWRRRPLRATPMPRSRLVAIPGGSFRDGRPRTGGRTRFPRWVTVAPFRLMRFEVTNAQFAAFVAETGHVTDPGAARLRLCLARALDQGAGRRLAATAAGRPLTSHRPRRPSRGPGEPGGTPAPSAATTAFRLPREEEWEFAARGTRRAHPSPGARRRRTRAAARRANYGTNECCAADTSDGFHETAPVGSYPAGVSPFGLHDMAGNVWEWTASLDGGQRQVRDPRRGLGQQPLSACG